MATKGHELEVVDVQGLASAMAKAMNLGIPNKGICATAADTQAKTVQTCDGFKLTADAMVLVTFQNAISAASATLNVNSTGAKPIYYRGAALAAGMVKAGDTLALRYDGSVFNVVGALDQDISGKADKATTLAGYGITNAYTKSETYTKTEVNGLVDTPHQEYVTVDAYANLPAQGSADTIYRVSNYNGSTSQVDETVYSQYAWNGSSYTFLCVKSQIGEVFDISVYNNNAKYADLAAALNGGANIPQSLQKGGMSVKFVQSSDNKYVQFRYMLQYENTTAGNAAFINPANWQGIDTEPISGSKNYAESGGIRSAISDVAKKVQVKYNSFEDSGHIIEQVYNRSISSSGEITSVSQNKASVIYSKDSFKKGDIIHFHGVSTVDRGLKYGFTETDLGSLSDIVGVQLFNSIGFENVVVGTTINYDIVIPKDDLYLAIYIYDNNWTSKTFTIYTNSDVNLPTTIQQMEVGLQSEITLINDGKTINKGVHPLLTRKGLFIKTNGTVGKSSLSAAENWKLTEPLPLDRDGSLHIIKSRRRPESSIPYCCFFDDDNNITGYLYVADDGDEQLVDNVSNLTISSANIPVGSTYVIVNLGNGGYVKEYSLSYDDISKIYENKLNNFEVSWIDDDFHTELGSPQKVKQICDTLGCKCDFGLVPTSTGGTGSYPIDDTYMFPQEQLEIVQQYQKEGFHFQLHPVHAGWYGSHYQGVAFCERSLVMTMQLFNQSNILYEPCIVYPGGSGEEAEIREMVSCWLKYGFTATTLSDSVTPYNVGIVNNLQLRRLFIDFSKKTKSWYKATIDAAFNDGAWVIIGSHSHYFDDSGTVDETTMSFANLQEIIAYANAKKKIQPISYVLRKRRKMLELYK